MNTTKIIVTYRYFSAIVEGYNGSRATKLAEVIGCWDTEEEAEKELDIKCAEIQNEHDKDLEWLTDHQRIVLSYIVTASLNGKLAHELTACLMPGEKPDWTEEDILATLDGEAGDYEIEFAGDEN